MLRAGALYFAIVIAFFIAVVSASLIMIAAHYQSTWLKEVRYNRLLNNLNSGVSYMLEQPNPAADSTLTIDLFGEQTDSLQANISVWGIYELNKLQTNIMQDTMKRAFISGNSTAEDHLAIYLADEDRPVSISGDARITGDARFPKSGLRQSYTDGRPYSGKELIKGKQEFSTRTLDTPQTVFKDLLMANLSMDVKKMPAYTHANLSVSFFEPTKRLRLEAGMELRDSISGNIIFYSDTTVTIRATAALENIQIYAPYIKVEAGFKGSCQLFASDSISIGKNAVFNYPSAAAVIRLNAKKNQPQLNLAANVTFNGMLFAYEEERSVLQPIVKIGKDNVIRGEVYGALVQLEKGIKLFGKVSTSRFIMYTSFASYENFLIDVIVNRPERSKYYLAPGLFKSTGAKQILQWLN